MKNRVPGTESRGDAIERKDSIFPEGRVGLLAGVHDALSAILAAAAGYDGLWLSGFGMSTVRGLPDEGLLSIETVADVTAGITRCVSLPVLVDGDNGFSSAAFIARMVSELERAGAAAVCFEDVASSKQCSFYVSDERELHDSSSFAKLIRTGVAARRSTGFGIVARTEALIVRPGSIDDALDRLSVYARAGASAVVLHSKSVDGADVLTAARQWKESCPMIVIPTTYPHVSSADLKSAGVGCVIFANQGLRAAASAMEECYAQMARSSCAGIVDPGVMPLRDILDAVPSLAGTAARRRSGADGLPKQKKNPDLG